jgi:DNA-binding MltR family transcriptional regulator
VLDLVERVVVARNVVVKGLRRLVEPTLNKSGPQGKLLLRLLRVLVHGLQKVMDVHALVHVQKEGKQLHFVVALKIYFLKFAHCVQVGLVLRGLQR